MGRVALILIIAGVIIGADYLFIPSTMPGASPIGWIAMTLLIAHVAGKALRKHRIDRR